MATNTKLFRPPHPSPLERFLVSPILSLAKWLYIHQVPLLPPLPGSPPINVVCISDTHNKQPKLPPGDILIHAGDLCVSGLKSEFAAQKTWLESLGYKYKIVIAGNHDVCLGDDETHRARKTRSISPFDDPDRNITSNETHPSPSSKSRGRGKRDRDWGTILYLKTTSTTLSIHGRRL